MTGAIYLAGPTASGKSAAALCLAVRLGGEIISVDSMQIYRGMDIGTAKPSAEEQARVPHHLIDGAEVFEEFDAARFVARAREADAGIRGRGRIPIYCGGTGLYFKALACGVGDAPGRDAGLRAELEAQPLPVLLEELAERDPELFAKIDQSNPRRVIRALEVIRTTGRPFSEQRAEWNRNVGGAWFGLRRDRAELNRRIDLRVDQMFAAGLVEETRELLRRGLAQNRTACQAIGYRQVIEHLRGGLDLAATIALVKQKTRQYAKRQMTWFRHQLDLDWIEIADETPEQIAEEIIRRQQSAQFPGDHRP